MLQRRGPYSSRAKIPGGNTLDVHDSYTTNWRMTVCLLNEALTNQVHLWQLADLNVKLQCNLLLCIQHLASHHISAAIQGDTRKRYSNFHCVQHKACMESCEQIVQGVLKTRRKSLKLSGFQRWALYFTGHLKQGQQTMHSCHKRNSNQPMIMALSFMQFEVATDTHPFIL